MELTFSQLNQAYVNNDPIYDRLFYVGITAYGIFCRSTCQTHKHQSPNVEFFNSIHQAFVNGYRPCKTCKPLHQVANISVDIVKLLDFLEHNPETKLSDQDLNEIGLNPSEIRRVFLNNYGLTFQSFQKIYHLNIALKKLQAAKSNDDDNEPLVASCQSVLDRGGMSAKNQNTIYISRIKTPIGNMFAGATDKGLCLLEFADRCSLENEFKQLSKYYNATLLNGDNQHIKDAKLQLNEYFAGHRDRFTVSLDTWGTIFQQKVWQALNNIPYGETRSYQEQANYIGKPSSVRAVANANGINKISIIIPCHRVIGSNGKLIGYGGGIWRKNWLLNLEQRRQKNSLFFK